MTTVAFVPVRGGSKGVPRKNLRTFCGRPLVYWCLASLQGAQRVDRVVVATECDEIERVVTGFDFSKVEIYRRSAASASDVATTEEVVLEYLEQSAFEGRDVFVLVQATSPFTRASDFDAALDRYERSEADSMLSCVRVRRFFWSDEGIPINYQPARRPRRQDFDGCLMENGAFYINRVSQVVVNENRLSGSVLPFEMPAFTGLELDEEDDWAVGETLMRRHGLMGHAPLWPIRLVLTDVDGVLTDGGMYYGEQGDELKRFNTLDGKAFELLRDAGLRTGIITAESTQLVTNRARKIRADHLFQGVDDKLAVVRGLCAREGLVLDEVAYVGDDLGDLELLQAVGFSACPATAVRAIKEVVDRVCESAGGAGCLREVADEILRCAQQVSTEVRGDDAEQLAASYR